MKKHLYKLLVGLAAIILINSCKKEATSPNNQSEKIPQETLAAISKLGFSTIDVHSFKDGYIVEGDIYLTKADLASSAQQNALVIAKTEQYRTNNLVTGLPRVITVSVSNLPTVYVNGANVAVNRYNALNLRIQFQMVSGGGDIQLTGFNQGPANNFITLGYSGFPSSAGEVYPTIGMNTNVQAYGTNPDQGYITGVIQHEMGHCIGFRHTDYFDRSYSCGVNDTRNEGNTYDANNPQTSPGAILIPGTPSVASYASFMLACSNGADRTFNSNDLIALDYLYGTPGPRINNTTSYDWVNGNGSGSGSITAPAGSLVHLTVSAYGPGTTTQCSVNGATLSVSPGNYVYMQNNSLTQTFTMPSGGSVTWSGYFQRTGGSGTGHISVY